MDRIEILQNLLEGIKGEFYLEIGVAEGDCFSQIEVKKKLGIDPKPKIFDSRIYELTSDEFFEKNKKIFEKEKIDVAFIDGLHTYEQSLKDVNNVLENLNKNGFIIMHDCNPPGESAENPQNTHLAERGLAWCGDVWKTIVQLRSTRNDLKIFVVNADFGVGVITKGTSESMLNFSAEQISKMNYTDLKINRDEFLNLKEPQYFRNFVKNISPKGQTTK